MIVRTFDELELEGAGGGLSCRDLMRMSVYYRQFKIFPEKNYFLCLIVFFKGMLGILDRLKSVIIWVRKQDVSKHKPNNFYKNSGYNHP
jgi:hypothetical protein